MNVLIVDDDSVTRTVAKAFLHTLGHDARDAEHGREALDLWSQDPSGLIVSDWMMPVMDGLELCRRVRAANHDTYTYFVMLTSRTGKANYMAAMEAGADDFLSKPLDLDEFRARVLVADRILSLRRTLHHLEQLLPVCSYCKSIRNDDDEWQPIERYVAKRSGATFSHGVCPTCYQRHLQPQIDALERGSP